MTTAVLPRDFLSIDAMLSDEERDIRDTVRAFVRSHVLPNIGDWFDEGLLPRELVGELGKLGVLGMHLEGYGCAGTSATAYGCGVPRAGGRRQRHPEPESRSGSLAMFAITDGVRRSRSRNGCRGWRPVMRSAASA